MSDVMMRTRVDEALESTTVGMALGPGTPIPSLLLLDQVHAMADCTCRTWTATPDGFAHLGHCAMASPNV